MPVCAQISGALSQAAPRSPPAPNPPNFSGSVNIDKLHRHEPSADIDADFLAGMVMVTFAPCARTNWHTHERGQLLTVTQGQGWVCDRGGKPKVMRAGDVVWCPPGTTHWHGADDASSMMHVAFSLGDVTWLEPVSDDEYAAKGSA